MDISVIMGELWDILVPILIIGCVILSAFADNAKKRRKPTKPIAPPLPDTENDEEIGTFEEQIRQLQKQFFPEMQQEPQKPVQVKAEAPKKPKKQPKPLPVEGERAIKTEQNAGDDAYTVMQSDAGVAVEDLRRAIVAHEILKRKF